MNPHIVSDTIKKQYLILIQMNYCIFESQTAESPISGKINRDGSLSGSLSYLGCRQYTLKAKNMKYILIFRLTKKKKKSTFSSFFYNFLWVFRLTICRKKNVYIYMTRSFKFFYFPRCAHNVFFLTFMQNK